MAVWRWCLPVSPRRLLLVLVITWSELSRACFRERRESEFGSGFRILLCTIGSFIWGKKKIVSFLISKAVGKMD